MLRVSRCPLALDREGEAQLCTERFSGSSPLEPEPWNKGATKTRFMQHNRTRIRNWRREISQRHEPATLSGCAVKRQLLLVFAAFHAAHHQKNERTLKSHRIFFSFASNPSWLLTSPSGLSSRTVPSHEQRNLVSSKSRCAVITKHALDSEDVIEK